MNGLHLLGYFVAGLLGAAVTELIHRMPRRRKVVVTPPPDPEFQLGRWAVEESEYRKQLQDTIRLLYQLVEQMPANRWLSSRANFHGIVSTPQDDEIVLVRIRHGQIFNSGRPHRAHVHLFVFAAGDKQAITHLACRVLSEADGRVSPEAIMEALNALRQSLEEPSYQALQQLSTQLEQCE